MLVGRETEVEAVGAVLARGGSALVVGEPGIGKTALAREVAAAHGRGVLEGGGLASLTWVPYLALRRALGLDLPAGDEPAVVAFVALRAGHRVLLLDDLHWADEATLAVLPLLAERLSVVATTRAGHPRSAEVLERAGGAGLALEPVEALPDAHARALVRLRAPQLPDQEVESVVRAAHGNPFLLEALAADRAAYDEAPRGELQLTLGAQVQALPAPARRSLALLALLGHGASRAALGSGVGDAIAAGLAVQAPAEDRVELRHALVGDAAVATLDGDERARAHAELARRVEDPGEAARHHLAADEVEEAHAQALRAAEAASLPAERARHLALAADTAPPERADELRLAAGRLALEVRDLPAALALVRQVRGTEPEVLAERAFVEGTATALLGDDGGLDRLREGERLVRGSATGVEARLLCELARTHVWRWEGEAALALAERSLAIAREPADVLAASAVRAAALYVTPRVEAITAARALVDDARAAGPTAGAVECEALAVLVGTQKAYGDRDGAFVTARDASRRARELGLLGAELTLRYIRAQLHHDRGELRAAIDELRELLQHPLALGEHAPRARIILALALGDSGDLRAASAALAPVLEDPGSLDGAVQAREIEGELAWLARRPGEARAIAEELLDGPGETLPMGTEAQTLLGWACHDLGEPYARDPIEPWAPAQESFTIEQGALVALSAGAFGEAEAAFERAAEASLRGEDRGRIRALLGAGEAALAAGDRPRAAERLAVAEREARERGYGALLGRIQRSLRLTGARRAAPRRRAPGAITAREADVLALVREGLTSAEIAVRLGVAPGTVDSQVRSAMRKLGASSRRQAAIMAAAET